MPAASTPWGLPPDLDRIPQLLRDQQRWVVYVAVPKPGGKISKVPRQARNIERGASTNAPGHWATFEQAAAAWRAPHHELSGIGFVLSRVDGAPASDIIAVDLDHCIDELGTLTPAALALVASLDTYTEISPSNTGIRMFLRGTLPGGSVLDHGAGVEIYDGLAPRYVTVTGHLHGPLKPIATPSAAQLQTLCAAYGTGAEFGLQPLDA